MKLRKSEERCAMCEDRQLYYSDRFEMFVCVVCARMDILHPELYEAYMKSLEEDRWEGSN